MAKLKKDGSGKPSKTYLLGRQCEYCEEPIEDKARVAPSVPT